MKRLQKEAKHGKIYIKKMATSTATPRAGSTRRSTGDTTRNIAKFSQFVSYRGKQNTIYY